MRELRKTIAVPGLLAGVVGLVWMAAAMPEASASRLPHLALEGNVAIVDVDRLIVEMHGDLLPMVGDILEIQRDSDGEALLEPSGTWVVAAIENGRVIARTVDPDSDPVEVGDLVTILTDPIVSLIRSTDDVTPGGPAATSKGKAAVLHGPVGSIWSVCRSISFDPLGADIPACTSLLEDRELTDPERIEVLSIRAAAYLAARTYRADHEVTDEELLTAGLADRDEAVKLARGQTRGESLPLAELLEKRGDAHAMLGNVDNALEDYTEALSLSGDRTALLLGSRTLVLRSTGRYSEAARDIDAAIRIAPANRRSNLHNWIFLRGELYESLGDLEAAAGDYREVLSVDPGHIGANAALKRLAAEEPWK